MSTTRHERAAEIFESALFEDDPIEHARNACSDDAALFADVSALLSARTRAAGFLQTSPMTVRETPLDPGHTFAGYEIVRQIARGGGGVVYEAQQANPRRSVALKVLRRRMGADGDRFVKEAQFLAQLRHPHIAHVYEAGVDEGRPFLVVELAEGARDILTYAEANALPTRERLILFARVCDAVQFAHQKGVAHCDLKPGNILVDQGGHPKLIDFGIARLLDEPDRVRAGTPPYMSPEQRDAGEADARSDVFALGILLEQLTARANNKDLRAISERATAHDPSERYAAAAALGDDVRRHLARQPVEARQGNALYQLGCFARRHTVAFGLLTALVAVSTVAALVATWLAVERNHERDVANEQRVRAEFQTYVASMSAAEAALRTYDVGAARLHLEQAPAEHRDWEWSHLWGRLDGSESTRSAAHSLEHGAVSSNGRWAVGASRRATVFDLRHPNAKHEVEGVRGILAAGFAPDNQTLALGDSKGHVWLVSADGREILTTWTGHKAKVWALCWLAGSSRLLTAGYDGQVHLWQTDGTRIASWETPNTRPFSLAVHDNTIWCGAQNGHVFAFDLNGARPTQHHALHDLSVEGIAISPDGSRLVTGSMDRSVCVWDSKTLKLVWRGRAHRSGVKGVDIDASGTLVGSCSVDRTACLWNLRSGARQARFTGHADFVRSIALSPKARVFTFSRDRTIKSWSTDNSTTVPSLVGHEEEVYALSWLADGRIASATATGRVHWWSPERMTSTTQRQYAWAGFSQPLSMAGALVAARQRDRTIGVWSLRTGHRIVGLTEGTLQALSEDGRFAFVGGQALTRHTLPSGTVSGSLRLPDRMLAVFSSPDGSRALIPGDKHLTVWDAESSDAPIHLPLARVVAIAFSRDERWIAAAHGNDVALVDLRSEPTIAGLLRGHTGLVRAVAWSPDGRRLATAALDGTVRLWDPTRRVQVLVLHGHQEYATALAWSPDGRTLVSGGGNSGHEACRLLLWRTPTEAADQGQ